MPNFLHLLISVYEAAAFVLTVNHVVFAIHLVFQHFIQFSLSLAVLDLVVYLRVFKMLALDFEPLEFLNKKICSFFKLDVQSLDGTSILPRTRVIAQFIDSDVDAVLAEMAFTRDANFGLVQHLPTHVKLAQVIFERLLFSLLLVESCGVKSWSLNVGRFYHLFFY